MEKKVKDLNKEEFTVTDFYDYSTSVWHIERKTEDLYVCRDRRNWTRFFNGEETVYPICFSTLDGKAYRP